MPIKSILVTGDWLADWNLARPANLPEGYFDGSLQTQLHHRAGGAWYVGHLIENVACRDLTATSTPSVSVTALRDVADSAPGLSSDGAQRNDIAHAYSVWWKHRRVNSGKKDDQVWRIAKFAGCRKSTAWEPAKARRRASQADLIVVDDLGLGFSEQPNALTHVISHAGSKAQVLLKQGFRPDGSGLLPKLLEEKFGDHLHVVTAAAALRRRNAALSHALSWDKALEDIEAEFKCGPSSRDLGRCATAVVHFGLAGAAVFRSGKLHRFYFLPDELEQAWEDNHPGSHFGTGSILTACMARHLIDQETYPLFFAVTQALAAQRLAHDEGAGNGDELNIDLPYGQRGKVAVPVANRAAACIAPPQENDKSEVKHLAEIRSFRACWNPADMVVWPEADGESLKRSRLLCNVTGTTPAALHAKAVEVVLQGTQSALASVPRAAYENYVTVDRDEIESINEIRRLILEYQSNGADKRPLSIAVFGAPGSGKSFAIKQIAKAIFGKEREPLEFNLTQIKTAEDLHKAFHQVRDASIKHEIPLVFWDEFDTAGLKWQADFLAPMQDAEFFDGSHKHPFGKCIFVFAGGTRNTLEAFKKWGVLKEKEKWSPTPEDAWHQTFKDVKGPDFVSRLRGFVNVKGPNPASPKPHAHRNECIAHDPAYVLRRAIILRGEMERNYPDLLDPKNKRAAIAPNVLHALLSVERYEHGARSISAILGMSAVANQKVFTVSALPSDRLLHLHVSEDFKARLAEPVWTEELLLALAKAGWVGWKLQKPFGADPIEPQSHRDLVREWDQLPPSAKQDNIDPVPRRILELRRLGFFFVTHAGTRNRTEIHKKEKITLVERLIEPEHRIWLSRRLTEGWEFAKGIQRHLRRHSDIQAFRKLDDSQRNLNRSIISQTLNAFEKSGYRLVRQNPPRP